MHEPRLRVSIVIPAYNEEHHLAACLQAIAAQTVRPFEVIVVDNGSTDGTARVAAEFLFVRVVKEARRGRVFARNTGFDAARGDIIGRIDADIILPEHWVAHVTKFYSDPAHAAYAWSGAGHFYNVRLPRLVHFAYGLLAFRLNKLLLGHYTLWGSNMAITKTQWQTVRATTHNRNDIHEDLDLAMHIYSAGYPITYDTGIAVQAELRRVHSDRHDLLAYLNWWPRTLRVHGKLAWIVCWFFGVVVLYVAALTLAAVDQLAKRVRA